MTSAFKQIPVTNETWEKLGEIKKTGQTYDQLIQKLVQDSNKTQLAKKLKEARNGKHKEKSLDDL